MISLSGRLSLIFSAEQRAVKGSEQPADKMYNGNAVAQSDALADGLTADAAEWENISEECMDAVEIPMGTGFLCNFVSPNVQVVFPAVNP